MKTRLLSFFLILTLLLSFPLTSVKAEGRSPVFDSPGLQFLTEPVFSPDELSYRVCGQEYLALHREQNCYYINAFGEIVTDHYLFKLSDEVTVSSNYSATSYGLYLHGRPVTELIYTSYEVQGDCLILYKGTQVEFYGLDGKKREPCPLPNLYSPVCVTHTGSVIAKRPSDQSMYQPGIIEYVYDLFSAQGKRLTNRNFSSLTYEAANGASFLVGKDNYYSQTILDANGWLYPQQERVFARIWGSHVVIEHQLWSEDGWNEPVDPYTCNEYTFYDGHEVVGSVQGHLSITTQTMPFFDQDIQLFQFEDRKYGLVDSFGHVLSQHYDTVPAYTYGCEWEVVFGGPDQLFPLQQGTTVALFDRRGQLVRTLEDVNQICTFAGCCLIHPTEGPDRYEANDGTLLLTCSADAQMEYNNGVWICNQSIVDPDGQVLSGDYLYSGQTSLFGLVNVTKNGKYYVMNQRGELQNSLGFDYPISAFDMALNRRIDERVTLVPYLQGKKIGIARYVRAGDSIFVDVPAKSWYRSAVDKAVERGLFNGTREGQFSPGQSMTRAMTVAVLYRMAGSPEPKSAAAFTDVPETAYYAKAVAWAAENGIVLGTSQSTFSPRSSITREQLAAILYRWTQAVEPKPTAPSQPTEPTPTSPTAPISTAAPTLPTLQPEPTARGPAEADPLASFPDREAVSAWAVEALGWAVGRNLIQGTTGPNGVILNPKGSATRAQVAAILTRFDP